MISYNNENAKTMTEAVEAATNCGLLQAFQLDKDPFIHAEKLAQMPARHGFSMHSVLDIGCGTGEFLLSLTNLYPHVDAFGINMFESQLPRDAKFATFCENDFESCSWVGLLDAHPGDVDTVFINYTLGHFDNLNKVFSKIRSMLVPGGCIVLWDIFQKSVICNEIFKYHLYSVREVFQAAERNGFYLCNPIDPEVLRRDLVLSPFMEQDPATAATFRNWALPRCFVFTNKRER